MSELHKSVFLLKYGKEHHKAIANNPKHDSVVRGIAAMQYRQKKSAGYPE